jgi:hypothetical protein
MWFKRSIRILVNEGKRNEAVAKVVKKFGISIQHAEDIIRELDGYQWHVRRIPGMDVWIKETLGENPKALMTVVGKLREQRDFGLLGCKLYMEDVTEGRKAWPAPLDEEGEE